MRRLLLFLALVLPSSISLATPTVQGLWYTEDHSAIIRIGPCGGQLCGTIARVLNHGPEVPTRDINNPDPRLRSRPILGMPILTGFSQAGSQWTGGHAYDPHSGRSYRASLALNASGTLAVTGCLFFICRTKEWTPAH
jgi:uncharacterized protein (DUF2147 family)